MAGKGLGWAGKCRAAVRHSGYVRACKSRKPPTLKYLFIRPLVPLLRGGDRGQLNISNLRLARCKAADPWLWLAGLSVCTEKEGVPLPRSGGGREGADAPAAPYKHRLAYDPGGRRPSGRAFRCVGVLGFTPSRFWERGPRRVVRPGGERRAHRSGEGCPECNGGSARLKRRLRPTRRCKRNASAASRTNYNLI